MTTESKVVAIKKSELSRFIPLEIEIWDMLGDGKMTVSEWATYSMIRRQVDFSTGIWQGAAYRIKQAWGNQLQIRTIQRNIKSLVAKQLVKSFHRRGRIEDYTLAIHGYPIRKGEHLGEFLDAWATADPDCPVYSSTTGVEEAA